ncbi:1-acyl-sn-glycerol-3-phosphate acyltransferase [Actinomadura flavalba]|uniref:1-acyl-sn-glycerol-3-phosphate acyltransferase n=1 Tax=Actinomadura flavalba TaxID=1120938 RepID=UPI00036A1493|nr:1-acyl-sn-glycerol-3-phosphate acyltransferase [Actinomadura flavalba]
MLPHPVVRRTLSAPLLFALTVLVLLVFPLVLVAGTALSALGGGRRRVTRLLWFATAWGVRESAAVLTCVWLWFRCLGRPGAERHRDRHYAVIRRYVAGINAAAHRWLGLRVEITGKEEGSGERPIIVLSRHAGPGDALLLAHHLLTDYGRRPHVVMKAALQYDPAIDLLGNRLPNVFVPPGGGVADDIAALAAGLGPRDALVLFPEGGNFTPKRHRKAIGRLRRLRRRQAHRAARLRHVMPPRLGGALAAVEAAPDADVVFVAHSGLEEMISPADVWRELPLTTTVRAHWWRIPAESIPEGREAREDWLYAEWERLDAWLGANPAEERRHA